jgi:V/A-type H+-transporting ATPase subunit K
MRYLGWTAVVLAVVLPAAAALAAPAGEPPAEPPAGEPPSEAAAGSALVDLTDAKVVALAASVAFVTAVSILGAAYAVGRIGSAALGAAAEKPELLNRSLALVGLAEGLAVIGFVVAFILLRKF